MGDASAQGVSGTTTITADSPEHAVDALVQRYGYVITFEGSRVVYEGAYEDMPAHLRRDVPGQPGAAAPRVRISKAVPVKLTVPSSATISSQQMSDVLQRLLNQTAGAGSAHYRVVQNGDVFDVIPTEVKDRDGNWAAAASIFDARITIPQKERSAHEMLAEIFTAVGKAAHVQMSLFSAPVTMLYDFRAVTGSNDEIARVVLARTLSGMAKRLTWRAFYGIQSDRYFIVISVVPNRTVTSTSKPQAVQYLKPAINAH